MNAHQRRVHRRSGVAEETVPAAPASLLHLEADLEREGVRLTAAKDDLHDQAHAQLQETQAELARTLEELEFLRQETADHAALRWEVGQLRQSDVELRELLERDGAEIRRLSALDRDARPLRSRLARKTEELDAMRDELSRLRRELDQARAEQRVVFVGRRSR